jgi:hypothetical protein
VVVFRIKIGLLFSIQRLPVTLLISLTVDIRRVARVQSAVPFAHTKKKMERWWGSSSIRLISLCMNFGVGGIALLLSGEYFKF